jgi:tetratricopeptide (TPR) repeat protein
MVGLAYRAGLEGRYEDAITDYRSAAGLFRDLGDTSAAVWTLNGLGTALQQKGRFEEAAACYGQVADLAERIGYTAVEALAQNNQGAMEFSLGDPGVAMEHFLRAGRLQRQLSQNQDAVSSGTNVAICLSHLGRLDEAAAQLEGLLRECEQGNFGNRELFVLHTLADVRRLQGRRHEAVVIFRRILIRDDANLDMRNRIESVTGLAAALADMDSSAAGLAVLQEEERRRQGQLHGITRVEFELAMGDRLLETEQPAAALARYRFAVDATTAAGLQEHRVVALAGVARCQRELGRTEAALALLRDAALAWEDTRTTPMDPEWREQRGVSGRLVYTQLSALILDGIDLDDAGPGCAAVGRAFDAVQVFKARTLAERIGGWDHAAGRPVMTLQMLQAEILEEGEVFLDAYLGPTESILFAVTTKECRAVLLADERTLASRLRLYHELLATPPPANDLSRAQDVVEAAGERLGRELLGSVTPLLSGSRRVVYAPDGPLNLVPLVTVVGPRGPEPRPVWVRVPSATILGFLRTSADTTRVPGQGILVAAAAETPAGRPLPGAVREVRRLARRYRNVDLRLAGKSGAALVPADLARYDILHLATHARVDDQRPWFSEIVLNTGGPAGRLRADRIAELDLSARLAVLSACETGSGRILSGEGVLGLSSAFLGAGVPTVVASLWPVADGVTAVLMEKFYEELSLGQDPVTALALAQDAIRADPITAHPFHWAGFVVVGDGTVAVDLQIKRRLGPMAFLLVTAAVIIVTILTVRRRFRKTVD